MPMLVTRALTLTTKRSVRFCCRGGSAAQFFLSTPLPSATAAAAISTADVVYHRSRSISTSPPLHSPSDNDEGGGSGDEEISEEKKAMITRWMKWNTSKTWRYEPNHDLIAKIGKESSPLDQFRDLVSEEKRTVETVGRSWSAKELRRKSYDDLHKLWCVLYKEQNMLLTESNLARRHGYDMVQPNRRLKVRKSMGGIKHVLGERKRKKIADHRAYLKELKVFDGLMEKMKLGGDDLEEAMDSEAEKLSSEDKA